MPIKEFFQSHLCELHTDEGVSTPSRYKLLHRKIFLLLAAAAIAPLILMSVVNYAQYKASLTEELHNPLRILLNKAKNSFELFWAERASAVSFIASAYSIEELSSEKSLNRIFGVMSREFDGFIDLGLINSKGIMVSYAGPSDLRGKDYSEQIWFQKVQMKSRYVSTVFTGFRNFPHLVIAVQHITPSGERWVLRATIDTQKFDQIIAAMSLEPESDAFLVDRNGVLQTDSHFYGKTLEKLALPVPRVSYETTVYPVIDSRGRDLVVAYSYFGDSDYILMAVKHRDSLLKTWFTVRTDFLLIFFVGVAVIFIVIYTMTRVLIRRLHESDLSRELAFRQVEHSQKLSSIGRLAAGVAHEINNPLAIINEKAGLMNDVMEMQADFPDKERFKGLIAAILRSVDRCRGITHRMLGFARHMDVKIEDLNVNEILKETEGFLEKEALYRNVKITLNLDQDLPHISSDRGQLQQVFLNILNNALAAVPDGGKVDVNTAAVYDGVSITFADNGCGMSEQTLKHIFEPFFTTKKEKGTGLGLSITYGIVKRLGGDIQVQSQAKVGTTFTVVLPKTAPDGV